MQTRFYRFPLRSNRQPAEERDSITYQLALTALTRLLIGMVNLEHVELMDAIQNPHLGLLVVTGCILMLAIAVWILRYASHKFPSVDPIARNGISTNSEESA